ncbi:hypothetical protein [Hoeflea prorocentri]|uniref:Uncharacterized protein n=1 Tax=Hoeflea prorocentri TaxID=1922333 RepID=A0A9X3UGN6_9HYPH|nr:hypothetical protein [Hoeflea prorocentri]MCY6380957.1 hypothetical protein [Hoeflea prorocentri]MDA5398757.1 hypothetical protein [Hoeflea prorocentri]
MIGTRFGRLPCLAVIAACAFFVATGSVRSANPLMTNTIPSCGLADERFEALLVSLQLRRVWKGAHDRHAGELELLVGRDGTWFLFNIARDRQGRKLACLVARGMQSREWFGRPV